jgi:hypothetical protein
VSLQKGTPGFDPVLDQELTMLRETLAAALQMLGNMGEDLTATRSRVEFLEVLLAVPGVRVQHVYWARRRGDGVVSKVPEEMVRGLLEDGLPVWVSDHADTARRPVHLDAWDPRV